MAFLAGLLLLTPPAPTPSVATPAGHVPFQAPRCGPVCFFLIAKLLGKPQTWAEVNQRLGDGGSSATHSFADLSAAAAGIGLPTRGVRTTHGTRLSVRARLCLWSHVMKLLCLHLLMIVVCDSSPVLDEAEWRRLAESVRFDVRFSVQYDAYFKAAAGEPLSPIQIDETKDKPVETHSYQCRQVLDGSRGRLEFGKSLDGPGALVHTFSSREGLKTFNGKQGTVALLGPAVFSADVDYRSAWLNAYGTISIGDMVRQRKAHLSVKSVDGQQRIWLPPTPSTDMSRDGFAIFLDGAAPTWPVAVERYSGDDQILVSRAEVRKWKTVDGLRFPLEIVTTTYSRDSDPKVRGKRIMTTTLVVDESRSSWQRPVDQSLMDLAFPVGTVVHDSIRRTKYTVGVDNPEPRLNALVNEAKRVQQIERLGEKLVGAPPVHSDQLLAVAPWWRTPYAYAIYAVMTFAVVLCFYRRRQLAAE